MIKPWFEEDPELLQEELRGLQEAGISFTIDEEKKEKGYLILLLEVPVDEDKINLIATFPINYPYFRPQVQAPDIDLPRHQHPFGKNLCMIPRPTIHWEPDWTFALYLKSQLPKVLETGTITDLREISENDNEQAEPFSDYYQYQSDTVIFIDSRFQIDDTITEGEMVIGFANNSSIIPKAALIQIEDGNGNIIHNAEKEISKYFPREFRYKWHHIENPLKFNNAETCINDLRDNGKVVNLKKTKRVIQEDGQIDNVIGIAFPEEQNLEGYGTGWVFIIKSRIKNGNRDVTFFSPAKRVGKEDLFARVPDLKPLQMKKVSIAGLGCLGAPSAIEFAKAGVGNLFVLDGDTVDPATIVRWPLGLFHSNSFKSNQIAHFINTNYPYCKVTGLNYRIGSIVNNDINKEVAVLETFFENTSLVFDSTAEIGVSHYLSRLAKKASIPFVSIYGSNNGWGGVIIRVVPEMTDGCWMCFRYSIDDGTIPLPSEDSSEQIQPIGCADPTFTGSSFDLMNISLAGVRLAISTLCTDSENGYPDMEYDVATVSFRNEKGMPIPPDWKTFKLSKHPKCPYCN